MPLTHDSVAELRREFPAFGQTLDGRPIAFFDGPGGTQVHGSVIDAIARYYTEAKLTVSSQRSATSPLDTSAAGAASAARAPGKV